MSSSKAMNNRFDAPATSSRTPGPKKAAKCQCPLYAYNRYDKMDPRKAEVDHYPKDIKTVYTRDYTPKKADKDRMDFSPLKTAKKSQPTRDNYLTTFKKDYTPKACRSTTPIRMAEHNYNRDAPLANKTEYKDMTRDAGERTTFTPVKNTRDKAKPVSNFGEHTVYQDDYTPKRNTTAKTALPEDNELIFRGHNHSRVGPMQDQTVYRKDYTPKRNEGPKFNDTNAFRESMWDVRPRGFDDLTIYRKDYVGPEQYACVCPNEQAEQASRNSHHN
jgi:hypothetical protein